MKHKDKNRKLARVRNQRKALLISLARSLILHGKIKTTEAKAKEIRPFVEKMITRSKKDTLANRRIIISRLGGETEAVKKLFSEYGPRYLNRNGGYIRIVKLTPRESDSSKMAQIEFV